MRIDTSALTRELTPEDKRMPASTGPVVMSVAIGVVALLVAIVFGSAARSSGASGLIMIGPVAFAVVGTVFIVGSIAQRNRIRRLKLFALENGFDQLDYEQNPAHTGWLFNQGRDRHTTHVMRKSGLQPVEVGTYHYETGSGDDKKSHNFGYIRLPLAVPLPHIFVDVQRALLYPAMGSTLPGGEVVTLPSGQRATLHAPPSYEQDAKALFQPRELQLLADSTPAFDAETIGTDLYLYMKSHVSMRAEEWQRIAATIEQFEPTIERWKSWRDLRAGAMPQEVAASVPSPMPFAALGGDGWYMPPGVAPQGQRMRAKFGRWPLVFLGVIVAIFVLMQIGSTISMFN